MADAITRALAREDLFSLVEKVGATHTEGSAATEETISFTHTEFQNFIEQLFLHQRQILQAYANERRNDFMGDDVPLSLALAHLEEKLGLDI
jgi:hypothetical protein